MRSKRPRGRRPRLAVAYAATAAILGPLIWLWQGSLLPDSYSVMTMGYADYGGGPHASSSPTAPGAETVAHHEHVPQAESGRDVSRLIADPDRPADVAMTIVARRQRFRLPSGRAFDGYTLNGTSPGPAIRAVKGQLVQVRLINESVPGGVTLHWHGVDVPNAADGVAGVTQDAVGVGGEFTYRFVADQAGTFWYHSHQMSHEQVRGGCSGRWSSHRRDARTPARAPLWTSRRWCTCTRGCAPSTGTRVTSASRLHPDRGPGYG
ncbi:multicopper oxidase domain-containing protein [Nonomuraea rubra]|uniref:multicopper oxidase domain-containing protein n=1 Tax=Nonomuraea rubra TaxID=46180 RepID=UPI003619F4A7